MWKMFNKRQIVSPSQENNAWYRGNTSWSSMPFLRCDIPSRICPWRTFDMSYKVRLGRDRSQGQIHGIHCCSLWTWRGGKQSINSHPDGKRHFIPLHPPIWKGREVMQSWTADAILVLFYRILRKLSRRVGFQHVGGNNPRGLWFRRR